MIHTYTINGVPQMRLSFPNGWTVSLVVCGDGTAALAHFPTMPDDVDPKRFSDEDRERLAALVELGNQAASAAEVTLYLQMVEALPAADGSMDMLDKVHAKGLAILQKEHGDD